MGSANYKANRNGLRALLRSDGVRAEMQRRAEQAAQAARASAPVDTGDYRDSIRAEVVMTDRLVGRVVASANHALVVEAKTRTLGRSIDAARG